MWRVIMQSKLAIMTLPWSVIAPDWNGRFGFQQFLALTGNGAGEADSFAADRMLQLFRKATALSGLRRSNILTCRSTQMFLGTTRERRSGD